MDYRYFPEPDLLPITISSEMIEEAKASLVELPIEKRIRYLEKFKL
jgi:aspartyl-tRNA(Asn)/glutamyl-tRNA(Gln) amidotransferase subunit B